MLQKGKQVKRREGMERGERREGMGKGERIDGYGRKEGDEDC